jgi:hypothetical protein
MKRRGLAFKLGELMYDIRMLDSCREPREFFRSNCQVADLFVKSGCPGKSTRTFWVVALKLPGGSIGGILTRTLMKNGFCGYVLWAPKTSWVMIEMVRGGWGLPAWKGGYDLLVPIGWEREVSEVTTAMKYL